MKSRSIHFVVANFQSHHSSSGHLLPADYLQYEAYFDKYNILRAKSRNILTPQILTVLDVKNQWSRLIRSYHFGYNFQSGDQEVVTLTLAALRGCYVIA